MIVGVDLDDTIISITKEGSSWRIKNGCRDHLTSIAKDGHTIHIITERSGTLDDRRDISIICKQLSIMGIHIASIVFTSGQKKGSFAAALSCKCIIDNNQDVLSDCIEFGVIPIHLKLRGRKRNNKTTDKWKEANSWREAYEIVSSL